MISISDYEYTRINFPKEPNVNNAYADIYKDRTCIIKWLYNPYLLILENLCLENKYLLQIQELIISRNPEDTEKSITIKDDKSVCISFSVENKIVKICTKYKHNTNEKETSGYAEIPVKSFNKIIQTIRRKRR